MISYKSRARHLWDFVVIFATLLSAILISYISFFLHQRSQTTELLIYSLDVIFIIHIFIEFRTTYKYLGEEVLDRIRVKKHYAKGAFLYDLLGVFPFEIFALIQPQHEIEGISLFALLRLSRLIRLKNLITIYRKWELENWANSAKVRIARFISMIIVLVHFIACAWFFVGKKDRDDASSWLVREGLVQADAQSQYIRSLYWSITTMTTVGYGDLTAKRNTEYILSMIVMALGSTTYAYIIGNIASLFSNIDISRSNHQSKANAVLHFLKARSVNNELLDRVSSYYEYIWEKRNGMKDSEMFNDLPESMRLALLKDLLNEQLIQMPLFKYSSDAIRDELLKSMKIRIYDPGSWIVTSGSPRHFIYFITSGQVRILNSDGEQVELFGPGDHFGELSLILKEKVNGSVQAVEFCEIFELSEVHFNSIKSNFEEFTQVLTQLSKNRSEKTQALFMKEIIL